MSITFWNSRVTQLGMGDDILAGICTTITGLYRDIYGIRPIWNRMGLEPNMSKTLNRTQFSYTLRDTLYQLKLSVNDYTMRTNTFSVKSNESFGASRSGNKLTYYHHNRDGSLLQIAAASNHPIDLQINSWDPKNISFTITQPNNYEFTITGLQPGNNYKIWTNNTVQHLKAKTDGSLSLKQVCKASTKFVIKEGV